MQARVTRLGRREVLRALGAMGAGAALSGCSKSSSARSSTGFFSDDERAALAGLADAILPPDDLPGGSALGAVEYIEGLLTALDGLADGQAPTILAGGPYSGRTPFGDGAGNPSTNFPPDSFAAWLALDRVTLASWKLTLFGSAGVPGGGPNDAVTGPIVGLRDQVKSGLADALSSAEKPFSQMSPDDLAQALLNLDSDFKALLLELVSEAAFSPPEYGGNVNLGGWQIANFEGDVQPLGNSVWDASTSSMRELPNTPVSTADPGPDPASLDADTMQLLTNITEFTNGTFFP